MLCLKKTSENVYSLCFQGKAKIYGGWTPLFLQIEGKQVDELLSPKSISWCPHRTPPSDCGTVHVW